VLLCGGVVFSTVCCLYAAVWLITVVVFFCCCLYVTVWGFKSLLVVMVVAAAFGFGFADDGARGVTVTWHGGCTR